MNSFIHNPVLMTEVLAAIQPRDGCRFLDGTIGGAGHSEAILQRSGPSGSLLGIDRDGAALEAAARRLTPFGGRFELHHGTFDRMGEWTPDASCDGILLDLGTSSPQLDHADRGFSFQADGPLDMRMDITQAMTAADLVNTADPADLERIFREFGEEPQARRITRAIETVRRASPLQTTLELARLVERVNPRHGQRIHPATRVFQALRIAVNDELQILRRGLAAAVRALRPGGRLALITFHSLEVRTLRDFAAQATRDYDFDGEVDVPELRRPRPPQLDWVQKKALVPTPEEVSANPRARSAQLRVLEKPCHGS